jgi:hypothetical protein
VRRGAGGERGSNLFVDSDEDGDFSAIELVRIKRTSVLCCAPTPL